VLISVAYTQAAVVPEAPVLMDLDQLFSKTKTLPPLYWLPLTKEEAAKKAEAKEEAATQKATVAVV